MRLASLVAIVSGVFVATASQASAAEPACSKAAAMRATTGSAFGRQILASPSKPRRIFPMFIVWQVACRDLTGDGRREMIVLLGCCTVSTEDPWAIFTPEGARWRLAFSRPRDQVWNRLEIRPNEVIVKSPVYARDDANCCPSAFAYSSALWNGTRFEARRDLTSPARADRYLRCGDVIFTPNSDDRVLAIRARGERCVAARQVAASIRTAAFDETGFFDANGYRCSGSTTTAANQGVLWKCQSFTTAGRVRFETGD